MFFSPTGSPKGAMLTHGNVVSNCSAFIKVTEVSQDIFKACAINV